MEHLCDDGAELCKNTGLPSRFGHDHEALHVRQHVPRDLARVDSGCDVAAQLTTFDRRLEHGGHVREHAAHAGPDVLVGSYPSFGDAGPEVEVVLKSSESDALAAARAWLEGELDRLA